MEIQKPLQFDHEESWDSNQTRGCLNIMNLRWGAQDAKALYLKSEDAAKKEEQVTREAFALGGFIFSEHDKFGKPARKIINAAKRKLHHKKQLFPVKVMTAAEYASQK